MTVTKDNPNEKTRRGFAIAAAGVLIGFAGLGLAFLDPSTGDGGSGGWLFKLGYAVAVLGFVTTAFGTIIHFATMVTHGRDK